MPALSNRQIVITRALHQIEEFAELLEAQGAIPILYPCIAVQPPADTRALDEMLGSLDRYDWLIITSTNTLFAMAERIHAIHVIPAFDKVKIAVIGEKTEDTLAEFYGVTAAFVPDKFTAIVLAKSLPLEAGEAICLPQSTIAEDKLAEDLTARGATVTVIPAYETVIGEGGEDVPYLLQENQIDALTFTSPSTVTNFLKRIHPLSVPDLPTICIGPSTAQRAEDCGFREIILPEEYSLQGMLDMLIQYFE